MEILEDDAAANRADNIAPQAGHIHSVLARFSMAPGSGVQNDPVDSGEDTCENDHTKPVAASVLLPDVVLVGTREGAGAAVDKSAGKTKEEKERTWLRCAASTALRALLRIAHPLWIISVLASAPVRAQRVVPVVVQLTSLVPAVAFVSGGGRTLPKIPAVISGARGDQRTRGKRFHGK